MPQFPSDLEIAQKCKLQPIDDIAAKIGLTPEDLEHYGPYIAKVKPSAPACSEDKPDGKLILVTAMTPTPMGEGKTTTSVGLVQALAKINQKVMVCLREPSMGPVFGVKGGAAGGGYSQVLPMEDINLHFTGDMHAITAANNLLAAALDNHVFKTNSLRIDPRRVVWRRCMDQNDRSLRNLTIGLGGPANGIPREDHFDITAASEVMAILCMAKDISDLKERFSRIVLAYTRQKEPILAKELKVEGAMAAVLRDAMKPNLVQTIEGVPAFIHGGPFANIAHGCNTMRATKMSLKLADIVVTEAGFGADLGAEKFFDIKCRIGGLKPAAAVIVATMRALRHHGGSPKADVRKPNLEFVKKGFANLEKHIENVAKFKLPAIVAVNRFLEDTDEEMQWVLDKCKEIGAEAAPSEIWEHGGEGGIELAEKVVKAAEGPTYFKPLYELSLSLTEKIECIATEIYGAAKVKFNHDAERDLALAEKSGFSNMPVCLAKTQSSFSEDPKLLGRPEGHTIHITRIKPSAGAGFVVAFTGDIMTMPGLPEVPSAEAIDIDENGKITGLF